MIAYIQGDIFESSAQVLVNAVNTVGVMGAGIALSFKNRYPAMFNEYRSLCNKKLLVPGRLYLWRGADKQVLLFPTKEHWRNPSKLEYIELGLKEFRRTWKQLGITSIALPKLGCGYGGLDWEKVKLLMEKYLSDLPIDIYIYV